MTEFAQRIRANLRSVDLVARLGGEEFLVAMPDTTLPTAARVAARLCELTREKRFAADLVPGGIPLSVSVGLALGTMRPETDQDRRTRSSMINDLLAQADHALYDAKAAGRDKVRVCKSAA